MGVVYVVKGAQSIDRRTQLNVIPIDANLRKLITGGSFVYEQDTETGVYYVTRVVLTNNNLVTATQPYIFTIPETQGATIDPISGDVTIDGSFTGDSLTVTLKPVYDSTYYTLPADIPTILFTITDIVPSTPAVVTYSLSFKYDTNITAALTVLEPSRIELTETREGDGLSTSTVIASTYDGVKNTLTEFKITPSDNSVTVNTTNGNLTIPANTTTDSRTFSITISGKYNDNPVSDTVTITQAAAVAAPVYITGFASATPGSNTYVTDSSPYITGPTENGTTYTFEPSVVCSDNNTVRKLSEYNSLTNKVNYTISGNKLTTGSWGLSVATVDSNGNLVFDLSDTALENNTNDAIIDYSAVQLTLTPASQEYNTILYSTGPEQDIMKYEQVKKAFTGTDWSEGDPIKINIAGGYSAQSSTDSKFVRSSSGYHANPDLLNLDNNKTYYIRVKLPNQVYFHLYLFAEQTAFPDASSSAEISCTKRLIINNSSGSEQYFIIVYNKRDASGAVVATARGDGANGAECTILTKNT